MNVMLWLVWYVC